MKNSNVFTLISEDNLNKNQMEAISHSSGPALVLAGAGSGKTRVLTLKITSLIRDKICGSNQILGLTFTNKAANEMKARIEKVLGSKLDFPWVGTFHSISYKILRINSAMLGGTYNSNFSIYDPSDQLKLLKKIIKDLDLDNNKYDPSRMRGKIDSLKNSHLYDEWEFDDEKELQIAKKYQLALEQSNSMDFGDLILKFYELMTKNESFKVKMQNLFKYVFVDEYQDTNIIQFKLINLLASPEKNLFAVGDEDQSIYGWRGANIDNILNFKKYFPETKIYKLEQNYRSTPQILNVSNSLIMNNSERLEKKMWTSNSAGSMVDLQEYSDDREEAKSIACKIYDNKKNYKFQDVAVFYRTNAQSRVLEEEFRKLGVQYRIFGSISFYERSEVKDCFSFLKFITNPDDEIAFDRIINIPSRGIGKKTLERIKSIFQNSENNFLQTLETCLNSSVFSKKTFLSISNLIKEINSFKLNLESYNSISESFELFLKNISYFDFLNDEDRLGNVSELLNFISEYEQGIDKPDVNEFLNSIMLSSSIDQMNPDSSYVTLMTVHLAKGLEFQSVYVVGLEEGLFPHSRAMYSVGELEEERRLCYVAMTRAINYLHLSYCKMRRQFGSIIYSNASQFLDEISSCEEVNILQENQQVPDESNRVFHYKFGQGYLVDSDIDEYDEVVTVEFDSGYRKKVFIADLEEV